MANGTTDLLYTMGNIFSVLGVVYNSLQNGKFHNKQRQYHWEKTC